MDHHKLFSDKSDLYKAARPRYPKELFEYLASQSPDTKNAWDCACGNGQAALSLIEHFQHVTATDISQQQIESASSHSRIEFQVRPAENSGISNESVDLVTVAQALHWFNFDDFWPEVNRVLKPQGIFSTWGYNFPDWGGTLDSLIQQQILDVIEPYWAEHNKLLWDHYRDVEFPFERLAAPSFTMTAQWNLHQLFDLIHTFSATRRCMDKIGVGFFTTAFAAAEKKWLDEIGDPQQAQEYELDFVFYAGRKR